MTSPSKLSRLRLGTAPDSWGVWFPEDPHQVSWEQYPDMHTGAATEGARLDEEQWKNLVTGTNELGRVMAEEFGVALVFHPHADTHVDTQDRVERFLTDTDPRYV